MLPEKSCILPLCRRKPHIGSTAWRGGLAGRALDPPHALHWLRAAQGPSRLPTPAVGMEAAPDERFCPEPGLLLTHASAMNESLSGLSASVPPL